MKANVKLISYKVKETANNECDVERWLCEGWWAAWRKSWHRPMVVRQTSCACLEI